MRILIVGGSRVGGTRIGEWIGSELGIEYIHEPISHWRSGIGKELNERKILKEGNVVVKVFPGEEFEKILNIQKNWDKVIGLIRGNERECAESMVWAEETDVWHEGYRISKEWLRDNEDRIEKSVLNVREWNGRILTNELIGCQITYEGIYETKVDREKLREYLNIGEWKWLNLLEPEWRYRKDKCDVPIKKTLI